MCGIIGIFTVGRFDETREARTVQTEASILLLNTLLKQTRSRGEDATGVAALLDDGQYTALKMGIDACEFVTRFGDTEKHWDGFLNLLRGFKTPVRSIIGHCRKSSVGNAADNTNNHPIRVEDIFGVHNGTLKNQDVIFNKLKCARDGEVDSEAIFRLFSHYTKNGKLPLTPEIMADTALRLEGGFTTLMFMGNNPFQIGMLRDGRTAEIALIKNLGLAIVTSERKFMETAFYEYNQAVRLYNLKHDLPIITQGDVEFKMVEDCKSVIFDLTYTVDADTKIEDIALISPIERSLLKKVWTLSSYEKELKEAKKAKATTQTSELPINNGTTDTEESAAQKQAEETKNLPATTTPIATTTNSKVTALNKHKETKQKDAGMLWINSLNKYTKVTIANVEEDSKVGTVEVDIDDYKNGVKNVEDTIDFTEIDGDADTTDKNSKDDKPGVKITKIKDLSKKSSDLKSIKDIVKDSKKFDIKDRSTIAKEVLMIKDDPEISKLAADVAKELELTESVADVAELLDIVNVSSVKALEAPALTNRVARHMFKRGFCVGHAKGYDTGRNEALTKYSLTKETKNLEEKINNTDNKKLGEKHIRILKVLIRILTKTFKYTEGPIVDIEAIEAAIADMDKRNIPSIAEIDGVLTPGDYRNTILRALRSILETMEKGKEHQNSQAGIA